MSVGDKAFVAARDAVSVELNNEIGSKREKGMKPRSFWLAISLSCLLILGGAHSYASDLDDGISKFTDDGMDKEDEMGKPDVNIKFIVMNAKAKAATRKGDKDKIGQDSGPASMNSVVLGAGSKVKGDIYIIDQSKGPKTNISD